MSKKRLFFVGASDLGREVLLIAKAMREQGILEHDIGGFLDENPGTRATVEGLPVFGLDGRASELDAERDELCVAIGRPAVRQRLHANLRAQGFRFVTLLHPKAQIESGVEIGDGAVVFAGAVCAIGTRIGANAVVNYNAVIGHDTTLGAHCVVSPGAMLGGRVTVGEGCLIGIGSQVLQGISIGDNATVGIGCSIFSDLPAGCSTIPPRPSQMNWPAKSPNR